MSNRSVFTIGFAAVCVVLMTSLYFQFVKGIMPCPLCVLQRVAFVVLGIFFLIGIVVSHRRWASKFISFLSILFSMAGLLLAGRQVWLQHFSNASNSECGVSLQYMLEVLPINEVMVKVFAGSAECAQPGANFLTLDMATWALLFFFGFLCMSIYLLLKPKLR